MIASAQFLMSLRAVNIPAICLRPATKVLFSILLSLLWLLNGEAISQVPRPLPPADDGEAAQIKKEMGPLAEGLVAAFSMDGPENGSAVVPSPGIAAKSFAKFEGPVQWVNDAGRQCANFSQNGALLRTNCSLGVAPYTIAVWMKFPLANGSSHAIIVDGSNGPILAVKSGSFVVDSEYVVITHGIPDGWHHVALTSAGPKITVFLDGSLHGSVSRNGVDQEITVIKGVGSTAGPKSIPARCDCLDDMFVYMRALTPPEIVALSKVRLPVHPPGGIVVPSPQPAAGGVAQGSPQAGADVRTYLNNLVVISGRDGALVGGGCVARLANGYYFCTSVGAAAPAKDSTSLKTLAGAPVRIGATSVAANSEIFVAQTIGVTDGLEVIRDVGKEASAGDAVIVFGKNKVSGSIDTIPGQISFIAADKVSIDTGDVSAVIGTPIIHLKTGKIIGFSTGSGSNRLDSVTSWQPMSWESLLVQAAKIQRIAAFTDDLAKLQGELGQRSAPRGQYADANLKHLIEGYQGSMYSSSRQGQTDLSLASDGFLRSLKTLSQADLTGAANYFNCDYFRRQLDYYQGKRAEILKSIELCIRHAPPLVPGKR